MKEENLKKIGNTRHCLSTRQSIKRIAIMKITLWLTFVLVFIFTSEVLAADVHIDPGQYVGNYKVGGTYYKGVQVFDLATGSYQIGNDSWPFSIGFDVEADGNIFSDSTRITVVDNTISFHTVPVTVDPGLYVGSYKISGIYYKGVQTIDLVPAGAGTMDIGSRYHIGNDSWPFYIGFDVEADGNIFSDSTRITVVDNTISFHTVPIEANPGLYGGNYIIAGIYYSGVQTIDLIPAGTGEMDLGSTYSLYLSDDNEYFWLEIGFPCDIVPPSIDQYSFNFSCVSRPPNMTCIGFDPPLDSGSVKVKKNRVLPVKSQLAYGGYILTDIDVTAPPLIQVMYSSGTGDAVDLSEDAYAAGMGTDGNAFEYNPDDQVWQFNLKTKNYTAPGTYTINMKSGDESEYVVDTCSASFVIE